MNHFGLLQEDAQVWNYQLVDENKGTTGKITVWVHLHA